MSWFLVFLFLSLTHCSVSKTSHHKNLPSAVVVGTVYCDTCFQHDFSTRSHFISGVSVAVECTVGNSIVPSFKKEVKTDEHGEFKVQLPFRVRKDATRIKRCTFKLISSSDPHCAVASVATSSSMSLKTTKQGEHIFSAGLFSFRPIKKPNFCNNKQSAPNTITQTLDESQSDKKSAEDTFFPPTPFLPFPPLPPIPFLPPLPPLPPIPFLPPLPPIPFLPPLSPNPPSNPPLAPSPLLPPNSPNPKPPHFPKPFHP
ncbi:platelet glycoprotein Ib alpha chain [Cajanus cajan]|uniref:Uncharacterized protein n=1 Tax=Cajanus cajan TaxID=3821 RepID=A0A151RXS7_CAJCA|nr:platelet glycoprotein Ib alpha chain [Cajanus cajan]KYP47353.1 hypothetical protein KK1_031036 [Cajanus cajan]